MSQNRSWWTSMQNQISKWNGNKGEKCEIEQEIQQVPISPEYNIQIFYMVLFNVKMIIDTPSSPVTDVKTQVVVNNYLRKILIDPGEKVSTYSLHHANERGLTDKMYNTNIESNHSTVLRSLLKALHTVQ